METTDNVQVLRDQVALLKQRLEFADNQMNWLIMTMLAVAKELGLPEDKPLRELQAWAAQVMQQRGK